MTMMARARQPPAGAAVAAAAVVVIMWYCCTVTVVQALPSGVTKELVVSGINQPVDLEFLPGEGGKRALVVSRSGTIHIADMEQKNVMQTYMKVRLPLHFKRNPHPINQPLPLPFKSN